MNHQHILQQLKRGPMTDDFESINERMNHQSTEMELDKPKMLRKIRELCQKSNKPRPVELRPIVVVPRPAAVRPGSRPRPPRGLAREPPCTC